MKLKAFKVSRSTWMIKAKKYWLFPWAIVYINDKPAKYGSEKKANHVISKLKDI